MPCLRRILRTGIEGLLFAPRSLTAPALESWEHKEQGMWRKSSSRKAGREHAARLAFMVDTALVVAGIVVATATASESQTTPASDRSRPSAKTPSKSEAPPKADAETRASELVHEALFREIYGGNDDRNRFLDEACSLSPNFPPAMWASGEVQFNKRWVKI